jgi:large conductance mechanosensitive channel
MSAIKDFKEFILRGNVVDLAVGVVIGGAFGAISSALVKDLITPLIGLPGKFDFSSLRFTVNNAVFLVGDFLNTIVTFVLIAFVVFFFVVRPINHLQNLRKTEPASEQTTKKCPRCLSSIPAAATKCAFCTSDVPDES